MDDPNITMKEYIRLEEEKARKCGKVFNWETTKYGKIWYDEDIHDLRSVETEFPAIAFNDQISSKNTFLGTHVYINDLKTDSENDNEKVNMPSFPPPESTVSCFDSLDFFKDFENEFPAIVYNNAQTSKSDLLTELILNPQHIDEFNLKDETSLSEYDEEEQNVLNFNDLFPFNVIYPNDSESDKDNDDDKVDIEHSSDDLSIKPLPDVINTDVGAYAHGSNKLLETSHDTSNKFFKTWNYLVNGMLFNLIKNLYVPFGIPFDPKRYYKDGDYTRMLRRPSYKIFIRHMAPLPPREQRHPFFRYQGLEYYDRDIADFKERIHVKGTHRVQVLDFEGMPELMRDVLYARILIEHLDDDRVVFQLGGARRHMSWRKFILALGLHTGEEMESPDFARAGCWIGQHPLLVGPISEEVVGRKSGAFISG
ncbi:hypothetical protein Tco_1387383 [Tanacetum coccineum]